MSKAVKDAQGKDFRTSDFHTTAFMSSKQVLCSEALV